MFRKSLPDHAAFLAARLVIFVGNLKPMHQFIYIFP